MKKPGRIGILGGAFNPIHTGHLLLAEQARELLHLKKIIFVPVHLPPHKSAKQLAAARQRYHLTTLAVKANPFFEVSDLEIRRGGISYSIETVMEFASIFPRSNLYFIVGSDFLKELPKWKNIAKLSKICKFVIAQRPGYPCNKHAINVSALDVSSTYIRNRIRANRSIRYLVPEKVRKYILKKNLYR